MTIIVSDHGFHPWRKGFNTNTWLVENGYMALENPNTQEKAYSLKDLYGQGSTLKEIFVALADFSGRPAPRWRIPHHVALLAAYVENEISTLFGDEPQIPLEGVRMARHKMWVDGSKATRELDFHPGSPEEALRRAAQWYVDNGYVSRNESRTR